MRTRTSFDVGSRTLTVWKAQDVVVEAGGDVTIARVDLVWEAMIT